MFNLDYYNNFQSKVEQIRTNFMRFLYNLPPWKSVVAYGAPAKGMTFLNYCGIRSDLIKFITDRSPHKVSKFCPGSHIPVLREEEIKKQKPDYILILAWNLEKEIAEQLFYVREWGCNFVITIPELKIW